MSVWKAREGMGRGRDGVGSQAGCTGEGAQGCIWGAEHTRGTHPKHVFHVVDKSRVEVQRLIKRLRVLRSRKDVGLGVSAGDEREGMGQGRDRVGQRAACRGWGGEGGDWRLRLGAEQA